MKIEINTNKELIFKQYLTILNCVQSNKRLSPSEINLLSTLLYIDDKYKHKTITERDIILFSTTTKKKIREYLDVNEATFNNTLCFLRKKKLVSKERLLFRLPLREEKLSLTFEFKVKQDDSNETS